MHISMLKPRKNYFDTVQLKRIDKMCWGKNLKSKGAKAYVKFYGKYVIFLYQEKIWIHL